MNNDKLEYNDELIDYISLDKYLKDDTDRKKKQILFEFENMGEQYLKEIERKNNNKKIKQVKLISYILKYRRDIYDKDELMSYCFEDVQNIYNQIKAEKKSLIIKLFHFLFNIE